MGSLAHCISSVRFYNQKIKLAAEGLTHADSMKQLPFPANCMNWNIGHIIVYREESVGMIDGVTKADSADFTLYGAGCEPLTDADKAVPLETLIERLDTSAAALVAALETVPEERLSEIVNTEAGAPFATFGELLHFYVVGHEAFHIGQLEILRELALA